MGWSALEEKKDIRQRSSGTSHHDHCRPGQPAPPDRRALSLKIAATKITTFKIATTDVRQACPCTSKSDEKLTASAEAETPHHLVT